MLDPSGAHQGPLKRIFRKKLVSTYRFKKIIRPLAALHLKKKPQSRRECTDAGKSGRWLFFFSSRFLGNHGAQPGALSLGRRREQS